MPRRWWALVFAAAASACSHGGGPKAPSLTAGPVGASIVALHTRASVAVANPDQGSVSFLDPGSLAVLATVDVGGEPHTLLELPSGGLVVANYRGGLIVLIYPTAYAVLTRNTVCAGPYGLALSPDASWVAVSCEWDGTVQRVDPVSLAATPLAQGLRRPRAVAVTADEVYVADYVGGMVHGIRLAGGNDSWSLVPASAPYRPALTSMSANLAAALTPAFGSIYVAHALENNTGDTSEPVASDYGTVTNTNPKINPAVTALGGPAPVLYAEFDGGSRVYSGPVALAAFGDRYLLVAHVSTANVAVLDTTATTPDTRAVAT